MQQPLRRDEQIHREGEEAQRGKSAAKALRQTGDKSDAGVRRLAHHRRPRKGVSPKKQTGHATTGATPTAHLQALQAAKTPSERNDVLQGSEAASQPRKKRERPTEDTNNEENIAQENPEAKRSKGIRMLNVQTDVNPQEWRVGVV